MVKPRDRQATFEEQWRPNLKKKECMLDEIDEFVDWEPIERRLIKMYKRDNGRPAIPPLGMFKLLLLEYFYNLSDVRVVEELHDRRSFERFCGIDLMEYKVDDSSLVRFRNRIREANLMERLFGIFTKQIDKKGLLVRKGTLVDSTLVKGAVSPDATDKNGDILDPDVACTVRDGKPIDGMKVSIGVDQESEIVRSVELSPANVHDHELFCELIFTDQKKVYAPKGYASQGNRDILSLWGIADGILHKAARNRPLRGWQAAANKRNSPVRSAIEHKFAEAKRYHGMGRLRYRGAGRNIIQVLGTIIGMNLKRAVRLTKLSPHISGA